MNSKLHKNLKIAVLAGGMSDEREVSLESGEMIEAALVKGGYKNVSFIDVDHQVDRKLREINPEVVVNGLHGTYGEDGKIQGLLEMMNIPYTGSGVTASAAGMDKIISKAIMRYLNIKTALDCTVTISENIEPPFEFPLVLKDPNNGSSRGVYILKSKKEWSSKIKELENGSIFLCEKYFKGREINVAVLDGQVIGDVEIIPANEFYDYESKYKSDKTQYIVDPDYCENVSREIWSAALKLHQMTGCRGVTRSDFLVNGSDYVMLEINTLPGMTSHSLVPMIAGKRGISYLKLIEILIEEALR